MQDQATHKGLIHGLRRLAPFVLLVVDFLTLVACEPANDLMITNARSEPVKACYMAAISGRGRDEEEVYCSDLVQPGETKPVFPTGDEPASGVTIHFTIRIRDAQENLIAEETYEWHELDAMDRKLIVNEDGIQPSQ